MDENVFGISEADFQAWRHHEVTKLMMQYLKDFCFALERDHLLRWKAGETEDRLEYEAAGRTKTLEELANLEFSHVALFYREIEQKETNETKTI